MSDHPRLCQCGGCRRHLNRARVEQLRKTAGKREGDQPVTFVTATEIRALADAWAMLDDIDAQIARVIPAPK